MVAQGLRGLLVPVGCQVVEDDHSAGRDLGDQHFADVGGKSGAIHRALYDPWCDQGIPGLRWARASGSRRPVAASHLGPVQHQPGPCARGPDLSGRRARTDLEGRCATQAARLATPDEIDALEALHHEIALAQSKKEFRAAIDLNTQFHLQLGQMARLPLTYEIIEGLWVRCGPILTHLYDAGLPEHWDPHPHIRVIESLRERDPEETRKAITYDIENDGKGLLEHVSKS